jgi:transposase
MESVFQVWAGIDWATEKHRVCAMSADRKVLYEADVEHDAGALADLASRLVSLAGGDPARVAVSIETPRGAVVATLMERQLAVFALNPKQLDRFRDRHTIAGAKDDRRDAFVLADSLRTDEHLFRRVEIEASQLVELRELVRMHEDVVRESTSHGNRLREQIHRVAPAFLRLGSLYEDRWLWDLLERAPSSDEMKRLSLAKIGSTLKQHRIKRIDAKQVATILRTEAPRVAPGVRDAARRQILQLVARIRLADTHRRECLRSMEEVLDSFSKEGDDPEPRDVDILRSLPGLGLLTSATLLGEAAQPLAARSYAVLRAQAGLAPVTLQSGTKRAVSMRRACNPRLRAAAHHWAQNCILRDPQAKAHYASLRAKGHTHGRALRGVADRLLSMLIAMLRARTLFDPSRRAAA